MRLLYLLLCYVFITCCSAQEPPVKPLSNTPLVLSTLSEQNGLSDDHVQCVLKDKNNFVWIGTADGLNLLDGSGIRIFRHMDNDTNSVISNNILSLAEDSSGNIWIGTTDGLSCYQRNKRVFSSSAPLLSPYGASAVVNTIVVDGEARIWCGTDGGLMKYEPVTKKFTPFYNLSTEQQSNITNSNKLRHIIADSYHELWLATVDGVWSFNLQTRRFKKQIHKNNDAAYHGLFMYVFEDHEKNIWAGNWQNGLKKIERSSGQVSNFLLLPGCPTNVSCINEMKQADGRYVLWLNGKLLAFDPLVRQFFHYPKPLQAMEYPDLYPAFRSTDGWMWMTSTKGLYVYSPQRQIFHHRFFDPPLTTQGIVFTEWEQVLLVGAQSANFLKAYDPGWQLVNDFSASLPPGHSSAALSFAKENENTLWVGNSDGIAVVNLLTGQKKWFRHRAGDSTSLPRDFITHLFFDSRQQLWVFPWREGIWQMDTRTGICKKLLKGFINGPDNIKGLLIADAVEDKEGNIWMADLDEGIILYDRSTGQFTKPFIKELGATNYVPKIFLRDGICYANTSSFIMKWDPKEKQLIKFIPPPEINKALYQIVPDKKGNWWLTSKNGLIVFNEQLHSFKRYTTADGLAGNDINGSLYCKEDGTILLGMPSYFTSFNPEQLSSVSAATNAVAVTEILVNEKPVDWDSSRVMNLDHHSTNLVFRWALPDHTNSLKNQYYCQLQGIDSGWKYIGNKGEIQYANLSAGQYSLLLKAASSNGTAAGNIIGIGFTIHPPFWKTGWFILLSILAILSLLIIIVRYISRRNLKEKLLSLEKEQAIEKERNRISRDMHDDLGSGLTKIAIMSEVVKKQMHDPEKAKQQLENISASSRELVDNLQDIIWVLNPKNDSLESLAAYIREYGLKFFEPFGIDARFNYPGKFDPLQLSEETRRNIFLVVKETFNNTGKHAWCNTVLISITQAGSRFQLTIADDGKGFDTIHTRAFGNGLFNMKNRMDQVGGIYSIASQPGKGTTTIISIST